MLVELAKQDNHAVIAPTYLVYKGEQVVGYIGTVPSVLLWLDTQRTHIRDTVMVANFFENAMMANGGQIIGVPCMENSPIRPFLERGGYVGTGAKFYLKNLDI